jgi:hypothetical protein
MTITLGVADPGTCWVVAAAARHGGGNLRPRLPHNGERAHGRRPVHAFARSAVATHSPRLGARPPSTAFPGDCRDLDSGLARPGGRRRMGEALPKRGHLTPIAPRHLEPARIRPRHPPRRSVSACTNVLPTALRAVATDLSRSASPPALVLTKDVARA